MLAMSVTPIRGRKLLVNSVIMENTLFTRIISSLGYLLTCLEDPVPHQVSLTRYFDLPPPWSMVASVHGANLPVLLEKGSRRGSINVLTTFPTGGNLSTYAEDLSRFPRTNPLGVFIIAYLHCQGLKLKSFQDINREFYLKLGTSRVIHLCTDKETFVYFSRTHNGTKKYGPIINQSVSDFCNEQIDEHTTTLRLNTGFHNLNGFRFDFIIREQHQWTNRRGNDYFGGRDVSFAILLMAYGMEWLDSKKRPNLSMMSTMDLELVLPIWRIFQPWGSKEMPAVGSSTAFITQTNEFLVVRKAHRIPFGLVLLLPFDWKTWSSLGGIMVLFLLASTLVHSHSFLISSMISSFFDIMELFLTGSSSRTIHWASQHIIVLCAIFLHIVVGSAYTGILLGFITNPQYFTEINSINEVVATHERLYLPRSHHDMDLDRLGKLKDNLIYIQNASERDICVRDIVMTGKAATLMSEDIYWVTSRYRKYREGGRLVLHKVKEPLLSPYFGSYMVPRVHLILHVVNKLILRLWQSGIINAWENMFAYFLDLDGQMDTPHLNVDGPSALEINQLSGPFFLLVGGMSFAGIVFLLEQIGRRKIHHNRVH